MKIIDDYMNGLKKTIAEFGSEQDLKDLDIAQGAGREDLDRLKSAYPDCPPSLLCLLETVNGTYHRMQGDDYISVYILGSDIGSYPYYLLSVDQIMESFGKNIDVSYLSEYPDDGSLDPKIRSEGLKAGTYIHFSNCMNNGGTSRLYIDFNPTEKGVKGQIVRYVHDPDEYWVIANSFDEYLQNIMDKDFNFIQ